MRVVILSSGGKDSSLATWWAMCQGWDIIAIINVQVKSSDSWMFQIPATEISTLQAMASGIPHHIIEVSGEAEVEVEELLNGLITVCENVDGLVSGALRSEYQRRRIDLVCEELGIHSFSPLWHQNPAKHMEELISCGMQMTMVSVSCEGLDEKWLGRTIDDVAFKELQQLSMKYRFNVDGEGGEFETIVLAGPHMEGKIEYDSTKHWNGNRGHLSIDSMTLI
jgi:diphthine-ammonia ligase